MNQLTRLREHGHTVTLVGTTVRINPAPPKDWRPELKVSKDEIVACLKSEQLYHGFNLTELEIMAEDDWPDIKDDPEQLEAFAHACMVSRQIRKGIKPEHYTQHCQCHSCGPVWLWAGAPVEVQGCPWCFNARKSIPIPRPKSVVCRECRHWLADDNNPIGGLGKCSKGQSELAWPGRESRCELYAPNNS